MRVEDGIDAKLDYALEMTFPASDPFTIYFPEVEADDEQVEADDESVLVERASEVEVAL